MRGLVGRRSSDMVHGAAGMRAVGVLNSPYDAIVAVSVPNAGRLRRMVMDDIRGGQSRRTEAAIALHRSCRRSRCRRNSP